MIATLVLMAQQGCGCMEAHEAIWLVTSGTDILTGGAGGLSYQVEELRRQQSVHVNVPECAARFKASAYYSDILSRIDDAVAVASRSVSSTRLTSSDTHPCLPSLPHCLVSMATRDDDSSTAP